jgi:glutamine amidotransferase-like uncharacterized protein
MKILLWNTIHSGVNCLAQSRNILKAQGHTVTDISKITTTALKNADLLVMPGGDGGWTYLEALTADEENAIRDFIKNGGGYLGTCAGAYLAAKVTYRYDKKTEWYKGLGIAPNIEAYPVDFEGKTTVKLESGKTVTLAHYNGAAMKGGKKVFGTYADNNTGYKGYGAIVGDYYGKGRVVLIGPHPELSPQHPEIIQQVLTWIKGSATSTPTPSPSKTVTIADIADAGKRVTTFIQDKGRLPKNVKIAGTVYTLPIYNRLAAIAITNLNAGKTSNISLIEISGPKQTGTVLSKGELKKAIYADVAGRYAAFADKNKREPNYTKTSLGNLNTYNITDMFSRVLNFYIEKKRLPNTLYVKSVGSNITPSIPYSVEIKQYLVATKNCQSTNATLVAKAKELKTATNIFNFVRDRLAYITYYNTRLGALGTYNATQANCCDHSHLVIALARAANIPARYVHGGCVFGDGVRYGHVWAQLYINGKWVIADAINNNNSLGTITNWNTSTVEIYNYYKELPF